MKVVIIVAVLCCLALQAHANCNLLSTAKIVGKLCLGSFGNNRNNQTLIDGFFGCYDQAPGKQQFVDCQTKAFGGPMSTVEAVKATCGKVATQISTVCYQKLPKNVTTHLYYMLFALYLIYS